MTIEVEKSDITRIGHTCHSKDGFLEIFCKPDTANLEEILLRSILKCLYGLYFFSNEPSIRGIQDGNGE